MKPPNSGGFRSRVMTPLCELSQPAVAALSARGPLWSLTRPARARQRRPQWSKTTLAATGREKPCGYSSYCSVITKRHLLVQWADAGRPMELSQKRAAAVAAAREILEATEAWFPFHVTEGLSEHLVGAGGYTARCRRLLAGLAVLVETGEDDSVGALYRTTLETYMYGTFLLLGDEEALDRLKRAQAHEVHHFESIISDERTPRPDSAEKLLLSDYKKKEGLVERLDALLASREQSYAGWAPRIHLEHYRVTSLHDAHGGLGCLAGHYNSDETRILARRETGYPNTGSHLLTHAVMHVGSFAGLWGMSVGLDIADLQDALARNDDSG